jgi:hypothetical protein
MFTTGDCPPRKGFTWSRGRGSGTHLQVVTRHRKEDADLKVGATRAMSEATQNKPCKDISQLDDGERKFIDALLVDGATFEDVVESVAEKGGFQVTLQAVINYFRANLEVQKRRVRRQVEKANELKKAFANPDSAEGELADATFLTGFMGVTRKGAELNLKDAQMMHLSRENLRLRNQFLRLKGRKLKQEEGFNYARTKVLLKKLELLTINVNQLKNIMAGEDKQNKLGPETRQKIQEIYGIVSLPAIPAPR